MTDASDRAYPPLAATLAQDLRGFSSKLKRRLRDQAEAGDLTPSQSSVLLRLERTGPSTTSGLARAEGMRPQSMGSVVAVLEAMGLVAGAPDPADGRQTLVSLTDECRTWISKSRAARQDWLSHTLETELTAQELTQLAAAIPLLLRLVGE